MNNLLGRMLMLCALIATVAPRVSGQASFNVHDAVERYAAGDMDGIRHALSPRAPMVAAFTSALDQWIDKGPEGTRARRRATAAAFAIETSWVATRNLRNENASPWETYGRLTPNDPARWSMTLAHSQPVVSAWVAKHLPSAGLAMPIEEVFWLAASGLAQDAHEWRMLQETVLEPAAKRLGDHPRLRFAGVLARTNRALGSLRERNGVQKPPGLKRESLPSSVTGKIPEAIRAFDSLRADARLAAEVDLRVGYLELRRSKWPEALARLDAAQQTASEPVLKAAADYLAGWILEQEQRPLEALSAYRRANAILPDMPSIATRLSALLYLHNEREEAYALLDRALNARPAPRELLITIERGDARFMPQWLKRIREAVR